MTINFPLHSATTMSETQLDIIDSCEIIVLPFPRMAFTPKAISLTNLYTIHVRSLVREYLKQIFETKFKNVLYDVRGDESQMVDDAIDRKQLIQDIFIEYGMPLETPEDLKNILATMPDLTEYRQSNNKYVNYVFADLNEKPDVEGGKNVLSLIDENMTKNSLNDLDAKTSK